MRLLVFIVAVMLVLPTFGQRKKKDDEVIVEPTFVEGIVYSLPLTGVRVWVSAEKETVMAGPFNGYAEQLLGIKNAPSRSTVNWTITNIKIETFSEPDPTQLYKAMGPDANLLSLTSDGRLAAINSSSSANITSAITTNSIITRPDRNDEFRFDSFTDTPFYTEGDSTNGFQPVRVNAAQKAAEAAKRILDCRLMQYEMVAGLMDEFHPDGKAYDVSLKELKTIEKNYMSLFVGRTTYSSKTFSFDFIPTKSNGKGEVVFRFSNEKGVVPASDLSGKPVMIEFEKEQNISKKLNALAKSDNPSAGETGVFYRIPGQATIKIIHELKTVATARATIAQFGTVAPVPNEMLHGDYSIEFHPETGAIKSVVKK